MGKVTRMGKVYLETDSGSIEKYAWKCNTCSKVHALRGSAEKCCQSRKFQYVLNLGWRWVNNGQIEYNRGDLQFLTDMHKKAIIVDRQI